MSTPLELLLANAAGAGLLALAAWIVSWRLRRPTLVHGLWVLALVKLVTPPLVPLPLLPEWSLPEWGLSKGPAVVVIEATPPLGDAPREPERAAAVTGAPTATELFLATEDPALPRLDTAGPSPLAGLPAAPLSLTPETSVQGWSAVDVWPLAGLFLLGGALVVAMLAGLRIRRFGHLLRLASPAPAALSARTSELAGRLGLGRVPPVLLLPARVPPMLWPGRGGPSLLMPADLLPELTDEECNTLLLHELAHVRRRDHWVRFLELAVTILFWWYPVAWWVRRALRRAEERCCDEWVLRVMPSAGPAYAEGLLKSLDFVAGEPDPLPVGASGAGPVRDLESRLKEILMMTPAPRLTTPARLVLALAAVLGLAVFPTQAQSPSPVVEAEEAPGAEAVLPSAVDEALTVDVVLPPPPAPEVMVSEDPAPPAPAAPEIVAPMNPAPPAPRVAPPAIATPPASVPPALAPPAALVPPSESPALASPPAPALPAPPAPAIASPSPTLPPAPRPAALVAPTPAPRPRVASMPGPAPAPRTAPVVVPSPQSPEDEADLQEIEEKHRQLAAQRAELQQKELSLAQERTARDAAAQQAQLQAEAQRLRAQGQAKDAQRVEQRARALADRMEQQRRELDLERTRVKEQQQRESELVAKEQELRQLEADERHEEAAALQVEMEALEREQVRRELHHEQEQLELHREALEVEHRARLAELDLERERKATVTEEARVDLEREQERAKQELELERREIEALEDEQRIHAKEQELHELEAAGRIEEAEAARAEIQRLRQEVEEDHRRLQQERLLRATSELELQLESQLDALRRLRSEGSLDPNVEREIERLQAALDALQ